MFAKIDFTYTKNHCCICVKCKESNNVCLEKDKKSLLIENESHIYQIDTKEATYELVFLFNVYVFGDGKLECYSIEC